MRLSFQQLRKINASRGVNLLKLTFDQAIDLDLLHGILVDSVGEEEAERIESEKSYPEIANMIKNAIGGEAPDAAATKS